MKNIFGTYFFREIGPKPAGRVRADFTRLKGHFGRNPQTLDVPLEPVKSTAPGDEKEPVDYQIRHVQPGRFLVCSASITPQTRCFTLLPGRRDREKSFHSETRQGAWTARRKGHEKERRIKSGKHTGQHQRDDLLSLLPKAERDCLRGRSWFSVHPVLKLQEVSATGL